MRFDWPIALAALAALPILVAVYIDRDRRRVASQAEFGNPELIPNVVDRSPGRLRYLPPLTLLVALVFLIVGVARPHATVNVKREEATIILAIDVSRSMKANDVEPTRLDAARVAAKTFLDQVPDKFQVGVVSFATRAVVGVAPTADRSLVVSALDTLKPGEGTAIGDAVALSLLVGRPKDKNVQAPPRSIVVISDGAQDGGRIQPDEAVAQAKKLGVPVYTVVVGTAGRRGPGEGDRGLPRGSSRVPANPETLQQVAAGTGGEFFAAPDAEGLQKVYEELGSRLGTRRQDREITDLFAALAAGLLLVGGVTSAFFLRGVWREPCASRPWRPWRSPRSWPRRPAALRTNVTGCRSASRCRGRGSSSRCPRARAARPSSISSRARAATSSAGSTHGSASAGSTSSSSGSSGAR